MSSVKLDSKTTSYNQLEKHYRNFIAPTFKVLINNNDAFKEGMAIESMTVENTTSDQSDTAVFTVVNAYDLTKRDFRWTDSLLQLGNSIEVFMGYTDQLTSLFFGYVTHIEFNFSQSDSPTISITAMDISFFMMRSKMPKIWSNVTIKTLVEEIGRPYGLTNFYIKNEDKVYSKIAKNTESHHKFLQKLAKELEYEFFVLGRTLYFCPMDENKSPVMTLEWGKQLQSFRVEHDIADQVTKVIVHGNIHNSPKVVIKEANAVKKVGKNSKTGRDILKKLGAFVEVLQETVEDEKEAQKIAKAKMQERSMKLVTATASSIGLPEIRSGRYIEIGGLGKRLNSLYYIESSTHTIDGNGYQTTFTLQGNAV